MAVRPRADGGCNTCGPGRLIVNRNGPHPKRWAFVSVGANLGKRLDNCCRGIEALCADEQVQLMQIAPFYETEPVDYTDQGWFLNTAIKIITPLPPLDLLSRMQAIQKKMGRKEGGIRFGPRTLDLDLILYQDRVMHSDRLVLPHPRMHKRRFVLQPICDIDPTVVHPVLGQDVKTLLNQLCESDQQVRPCSLNCSSILQSAS